MDLGKNQGFGENKTFLGKAPKFDIFGKIICIFGKIERIGDECDAKEEF